MGVVGWPPLGKNHFLAKWAIPVCVHHDPASYVGVVTEMEERIADAFKAQDLDAASEILAQMKYYQTILDSIDDKLHEN